MADTLQAATAEETADSREIRVFLSSTFRDFNEERRLLATQVFPELNRRARERGVELVEVDLRWGVTQEQAEDGHALEICLAEIERCRRYFIGMLGDSYGSLTPPERQLLQAAPELLEQRQWLNGKIGQASYTELEIEQRLQQMGGNASDGRAFFYFRDPAWSDPKADAGEPGWRSDDPADRQKLELLRNRIRSSGYPLVEGLRDPQAIADQIKDDLWALIDRQFPEGEQPDALQKEARKHADYRRSRTGAGQYIGGEGYIQQLERWIAEGQQQILITGESGAGKSALLANWMERHSQSNPADVLYAHHLGCTNDANALRPLLGRLIDTASQQLLDAGVSTEALAVPEEWWELVARVAETLQTLGRWCQSQGRRWIWVLDGLDRLDPDDQNALPWLPLNLPDGVQVVASALACPAREILLERGYTTLTIEPLEEKEQEQLIQRYLKRYTKELDGGLRQQILSHHLAGSPLFLKVLLEELRQCGRHDTLKEQLAFYLSSQTVDDLYERVLERLENDGSGEAVRKVMTALWASRAGLTEPELLAITDLRPLQWAPIDLALEKALGRNGNRLVFDHDYLRIAVRDRYLPTDEQQQQAHSLLADWIGAKDEWDARKAEELPWQLQQAGRLEDLRDWLLKPWALANLQWDRGSREVINYWLAVKDLGDGELDELIAEVVEEEIEKRKEEATDQIWFVDRIAALLDEAGLYRELLLRLRTLSLELEEAMEDRDEESILSSLSQLARMYRNMGNFDQAKQLYYRCLDAREKLLGLDHPDTLGSLGNLAGLFLDKRDYEQAEAYFKRDLEASERLLGPEHPDTLNTLGNLGLLYIYTGDYVQAEAILARCIEAETRLLGADHRATLASIHNLGLLYLRKGDYNRSEGYYTHCLETLNQLLGNEHPFTLTTVHNLADLYQKKGDIEKSEVLYTRCLQARERLLGSEHPDTNLTRSGLAYLLFDQKRYAESIQLNRQNLEAAVKRDGRDAPHTLNLIHRLALDLYLADELEESEQLYREALAGRIAHLGDEDSTAMESRVGLARCLSAQERYSEAIELRRVELAWWQAKDVVDTTDMLNSMHGLGCELLAADETDEAFNLLQSCLSGREQALGFEHPETLSTAYFLAEVMSQQGRPAEAIPLRRRELAWSRQQNGDTDPGTLNSINALAIDLRETGELEEAETLFRELLAARMQVLEPSDFDIGQALGGLARTLGKAGKLEEAAVYRLKALDHRLAHEGADAWWTNRERLGLASVLHKLDRSAEALYLLEQLQESMAKLEEPDEDDQQLLDEAKELHRLIVSDGLRS